MIVRITPRSGRVVLHPVTRRRLVGPEVAEFTAYWQRRMLDGDVEVEEISATREPDRKTKQSPTKKD